MMLPASISTRSQSLCKHFCVPHRSITCKHWCVFCCSAPACCSTNCRTL